MRASADRPSARKSLLTPVGSAIACLGKLVRGVASAPCANAAPLDPASIIARAQRKDRQAWNFAKGNEIFRSLSETLGCMRGQRLHLLLASNRSRPDCNLSLRNQRASAR